MTKPRTAAMIRAMNETGYAIDLWIGELARLGRTEATRTKYMEILFQFADHIGRKALYETTTDDCRSFLDRWIKASPSTLALHVSILRGFFAFAMQEGWVDRNPMDPVKRPRRPRPEDLDVLSVSATTVEKLFARCEEWDEFLCIAVLAYLGPRRRAVALCRRQDVDLEQRTIRFREKGGKTITKSLPDELAAIIQAADEHGVWAAPGDYLIPNRRTPSRRGERSPKVVYAIVKRVADRAGVAAHPHALRAAFAVQFDEQKPGRIWTLKEILGHARIETTLVYLRRKDRAKAMEEVRDLHWGGVFPSSGGMPPTGFEPVLPTNAGAGSDRDVAGSHEVTEPLRRKLEELRDRPVRHIRRRR